MARRCEANGLPSILSRKNDALRVPLLFDPGSDWEYGIGLDLVGKVVEEVTDEDLESYSVLKSPRPFRPLCLCPENSVSPQRRLRFEETGSNAMSVRAAPSPAALSSSGRTS